VFLGLTGSQTPTGDKHTRTALVFTRQRRTGCQVVGFPDVSERSERFARNGRSEHRLALQNASSDIALGAARSARRRVRHVVTPTASESS